MDSRLSDFLARAESVLARLEPLLPAVREAVDWERSLAARWHRDGFAYGRQQRLQAREHAFGAGKKIAQSGIHSVLLGSD